MLQFEELRLELLECEKPLAELAEALGLEEMKKEIAALEEQTAAPGFWEDLKTAQRVQQQMSSLKSRVDAYDRLKADYDDALMMIELSDEEEDESMFPDCRESVDKKYRSLVKLYHPDNMDGDTAALQEINVQYDKAKKRWS